MNKKNYFKTWSGFKILINLNNKSIDFKIKQKMKNLQEMMNFIVKNGLIFFRKVDIRDEDLPLIIKKVKFQVGEAELSPVHNAAHIHMNLLIHHSPMRSIYVADKNCREIVRKLAEEKYGFSKEDASKILFRSFNLITVETQYEYANKKFNIEDVPENPKIDYWDEL